MTHTSSFLTRLAGLALLLAASGLQAQEVVYYHTDALGSVVAVTDQTRNVIEKSEYEPYGYVTNHPPTDGPGYTGHVLDALTGMNYMQQRYYDPVIGRFLSRDPVTADPNTGANFNAYWYANNNPYKFTDPDGRESGAFYTNSQYQMAQPSTEGAGLIADFIPVVSDVKGVYEAYREPTFINIAAAGAGFIPVVGDVGAKLIKNADDVVAAAGATLKKSGDFEAPGGREAAKKVFREADAAGKGSRKIVSDKTGGGRSVVGKTKDGTPMRIRMKPDGSTRIQVGKEKIIFPKEDKLK